MIQRIEYLDNLKTLKYKQVIKVIAGVIRCGKSTLFELYIDYLKKMGIEDMQTISINLEDLENADLLSGELANKLKNVLPKKTKTLHAVAARSIENLRVC